MASAAQRSIKASSLPAASTFARWNRWLLAAAVVLVYLATFALLPRGGFWICDNGAKFIQLQGLLRTDYRDYSVPWLGVSLDPNFTCSPLPEPFGHVVDGRLYCMYAPFFPLISSLLFRLCGLAGLYILPLAGGLLILPAVWRLAGLFLAPRGAQPLAVLLVALTTPVWFYSLTFWEHTPAACLAAWSIYFCIRSVTLSRAWDLPLAAFCCGLSIYFRDDLYLLVPVLGGVLLLYSRHRGRALAGFAAVLLASLAPLWLFQWRTLGHPFGLHFGPHNPLAGGVAAYLAGRWPAVRALLFSAHGNEWLSVALVLPALVLWVTYPRVTPRTFRWLVVIVAGVALASGLIILRGHLTADSPLRYLCFANGLLAVSPVLWLAFVRLRAIPDARATHLAARQDVRIERILWLIVLAYTLLYVLVAPARIWGGLHWGCRFLLVAYPLLCVPAAVTIARWWQAHAAVAKGSRAVLAATVAVSLLMQLYSLRLLRDRDAFTRTLNQTVAARPEQIVATNVWYLAMDLAPCFYDKTIFFARTPGDLLQLGATLRRAGQSRVLLIQQYDRRASSAPVGPVLQDGSLNFCSVEFVSVPFEP